MPKNATLSTKESPPRRGAIKGVDKRMEQMLKSGDLSDVEFSVGRHFGPAKIFKAHKFVLSSGSDVFYTMFHGSLPEKGNDVIELPDIHPKAFRNMLTYIYGDGEGMTKADVFPTLQCAVSADKYDVSLLADICFNFIMEDLIKNDEDPDRLLLHLENALTWAVGLDSVVENCLHFVDVHCEEVFKSQRFTELQPATLRAILERDTLFAEESLICMAADRWAVAACIRNDLEFSPANRREVLGELFYLIRFPAMTDSQVADLAADCGLLEASELSELRHDKQRFPMEPRTAPVIRVGDVEFQHKENVFVQKSHYWRPTVVVGARGSLVLCLRNSNPKQMSHIPLGDLIRASDILAAKQHVVYPVPGYANRVRDARYVRMTGDQHIIKMSGKEETVKFSQIFLNILEWKRGRRLRLLLLAANARIRIRESVHWMPLTSREFLTVALEASKLLGTIISDDAYNSTSIF
ncbi:BTB/POZ domain-containing protein 3-like [Paramacrobiotus metropolitanus]|uniref:BTB/POZ domain-containing protein 3-like n=1 Tax=Paramacrobiotus metropolitanus TaxID=2943436 RepID=UPI002445BA0D|nr:BTB/POZ domain-containing protein 3-like [Paramacrobiotus metropolitanus]